MKMAEDNSIAVKIGAENDKIHRYVQQQNKSATESSHVVPNPVRDSCDNDDNTKSTITVDDSSSREKAKPVQLANGTKEIDGLPNRNTTTDDSKEKAKPGQLANGTIEIDGLPNGNTTTDDSREKAKPGQLANGTIEIDGLPNSNTTTDTTTDDSREKAKSGQLANGTIEIDGLTHANNYNERIINGNTTTTNISNASNIDNSPRKIIDLVPVAKEMWKFDNRPVNPMIASICTRLPAPMHNAILKTTVFRFQKRAALPDESKGNYTPKAKFYIDLLRTHNSRLASEPFKLVAFKCAYCSIQPDHVPGCCSFVRISRGEDISRLLSDALHQRLLHLRNSCKYARSKHGADVSTLFNNRYNRQDHQVKAFIKLWLKELKNDGKTQQQQTGLENISNQQQQQERFPPSTAGVPGTKPQPTSIEEFATLEERATLHARARAHALDDRTTKYVRKGMKAMQSNTNTAAPPTSTFVRTDWAMMAPKPRQQIISNQQHQANYHMLLQQRLQQQQQEQQERRRQQHQQQQQQQQQQQNLAANFPLQLAYAQLTPQQRQLVLQKKQQQMIQRRQFLLNKQQHQLQLQQQIQPQQQQFKQQQKAKYRQRLPTIFPRNKTISFEELQEIFEEYWTESLWSAFTPLYDSDGDDDETEIYFSSIYKNENKNERDTDKTHMEIDTGPCTPHLSQSELKLDYYIPVQPHQLAQCQGHAFFLKDEDTLSVQRKSRGRPRKSSQLSQLDVTLSDVKHRDVVMMCDGCPAALAKALHDLKGNRYFLRLVSAERSAYVASTSDTKSTEIVKSLIQKIKKCGGCFLKASTTKRRICRTWKTTDKEVQDYTRFRLEYGFPDILNNPKIGIRTFRCSAHGAGGPRPSVTSTPVATKETADLSKEPVNVIDLSSIDDANDKSGSAESSPAPAPAPQNETPDWSSIPSKVFDVEYAPKVGLINGFLEWNNNKTNNPIMKFPQLKISPTHNSKRCATALLRVDEEECFSNSAVNGQKKPDTDSSKEARAEDMDDMQSGGETCTIGEGKLQESGVKRKCSEIEDQQKEVAKVGNDMKRHQPDSSYTERSLSQSMKQ